MYALLLAIAGLCFTPSYVRAACMSSSSSTTDLQNALEQGGEGYTLQLCAGETYSLDQVLNYTAPNQVRSDIRIPYDSRHTLKCS